MAQFDLRIQNMNCSSCVAKIESRIQKIDGVIECLVNFASGQAHVEYEGAQEIKQAVADAITDLRYPATVIKEGEDYQQKDDRSYFWLKFRTIFAILLTESVYLKVDKPNS